jgi:hypothetical protein
MGSRGANEHFVIVTWVVWIEKDFAAEGVLDG